MAVDNPVIRFLGLPKDLWLTIHDLQSLPIHITHHPLVFNPEVVREQDDFSVRETDND